MHAAEGEVVAVHEALVGTRGVHLIAHEHIPPLPPRRVRAAHEPRPPELLDAHVGGVEVVLGPRHELRTLGTAALHPVAHVENHESVVPVRQIGEAVGDHHVVQVASGLRLLGLPARDLLGVVRIADVDHPQRSRGVVRDVGVALVDVGAVHAAAHGLRVLGDRLGVAGVGGIEDDDTVLAVRGALAGEHAVLAVLRRHHVVDDARIGEHRVGDLRMRGVADVDRVHAVGDGGEVRTRARRMHPDFRDAELDRQVSPHFDAAGDPALFDFHHRVRLARPDRRGDGVRPRELGHERPVGIELGGAAPRLERPARRDARDRAPRRILRGRREADHVAGADRRRGGLQGDAGDRVRDDLNGEGPGRRARLRRHGDASRRDSAEDALRRDARDPGVTRGEGHRVVAHVVVRAVGGAGQGEAGADDQLRRRGRDFHAGRRLGKNAVDGEADLLPLAAHHGGHRTNAQGSGVAGGDQPGRVYLPIVAADEPVDARVGHGLSAGVQSAGRELQRLPDLQLAAGGSDLDLDHRRRRQRRRRWLLQQGEEQRGEIHANSLWNNVL